METLAGATPVDQITPEVEAGYIQALKQYCNNNYKSYAVGEEVCMEYVNAISDPAPSNSRRDIVGSELAERKFCPWCRKHLPKIIPVVVKLCELNIIC
jgi:hypothetical protein